MLRKRIIPCLDIKDGRVVKGVKFNNLRDSGNPAELALRYEAEGADELSILDISATPEGRNTKLDVIERIRKQLGIPLCVGGGVRSVEDARRLLEAGADKVALNTQAVLDPTLIGEIARRFGAQCTILSLDARRNELGWSVVTHSGKRESGIDAMSWASEAISLGAGEILLTSLDRDGTRLGYDTELLQAVASIVTVPVIASGGASSAEHLRQAFAAGADAVLAASIFHEQSLTIRAVKEYLHANGIPVRL